MRETTARFQPATRRRGVTAVARIRGPWIGSLGLRLALVFVGVAFAAVAAVVLFGSVATSMDVDHLIKQQRADAAQATAIAAAVAYGNTGWRADDLLSLTKLVGEAGAAVQVRDRIGQAIGASPDFASQRGLPQVIKPVIVSGRKVGSVALRFGHSGLAGDIERFQGQRWFGWISAAALAGAIAVVAALLVSLRITRSLDRLITTARARGH